MNPITPKQKIVIQAIKIYFAKNGRMPSIREIRDEVVRLGLNIKSSRSIFLYLKALESAGYLKRQSKKRGMELLGLSLKHFINIPVLGMANAGSPSIIAEENIEGYLKISKGLIPSKETFAIKVSGDSMNKSVIKGKKIEDGDYVLVDGGAKNFFNGDKILVVLDGLATIKTFRRLDNNIIGLFPESKNKTHQPIYIKSGDSFIINGKVIDVFKNTK